MFFEYLTLFYCACCNLFQIKIQGCGNQIFDYSKIITLRETEEELADTVTDTAEVELKRPGTRTIDSSGENFKHLPVVEITIR